MLLPCMRSYHKNVLKTDRTHTRDRRRTCHCLVVFFVLLILLLKCLWLCVCVCCMYIIVSHFNCITSTGCVGLNMCDAESGWSWFCGFSLYTWLLIRISDITIGCNYIQQHNRMRGQLCITYVQHTLCFSSSK